MRLYWTKKGVLNPIRLMSLGKAEETPGACPYRGRGHVRTL